MSKTATIAINHLTKLGKAGVLAKRIMDTAANIIDLHTVGKPRMKRRQQKLTVRRLRGTTRRIDNRNSFNYKP